MVGLMDMGPLCMHASLRATLTPLYYAGIMMGTLGYARIHMGPFVT
jgi:hypothetical protein